MSREKQAALLAERRNRGFPWHGPPHLAAPEGFRIVTAACFEHQPMLTNHERLAWFERELLDTLRLAGKGCAAWCVLPNHYHALVRIEDVKSFARNLGLLHGRTSFAINREDRLPGRTVWHRCQDRAMRSERHYHASVNYIHNNPVKHGLVKKWQKLAVFQHSLVSG